MTPLFLNSATVELFISPYQDSKGLVEEEEESNNENEDRNTRMMMIEGDDRDHKGSTSSRSNNNNNQNVMVNGTTATAAGGGGAVGGGTLRVCSDCYTTTTPLWRSGPRGPKSLCNACGIRQRKARRALAEAAAAAATATTTATASTSSPDNKEKKWWRGSGDVEIPKTTKYNNNNNNNNKVCFTNFSFHGLSHNYTVAAAAPGMVFSEDVTEAAHLLMELSCGFVHS